MQNIGIIDYGCGNIRSVAQAFEYLGHNVHVIYNAEESLEQFSHLVLPGVGSYSKASENITELGLRDVLKEQIGKGKPLLGICVGMQLLFDEGWEFGCHIGIGAIKGVVRHLNEISPQTRTPNTGWAQVNFPKGSTFFSGHAVSEDYYFNHSYACIPQEREIICAHIEGESWPSVVIKNNIWGIQCHPEKSQKAGLNFLRQFLHG